MNLPPAPVKGSFPDLRGHFARRNGSLIIEVSVAMAFAAILALIVMKASLLALANNQWTIMQTLTDACLSRESALANRVPIAALTGGDSPWPDLASAETPRSEQTISLGRLAGGGNVEATLIRFRVNETAAVSPEAGVSVWRLHSVLSYKIGDQSYLKSRATLRVQ